MSAPLDYEDTEHNYHHHHHHHAHKDLLYEFEAEKSAEFAKEIEQYFNQTSGNTEEEKLVGYPKYLAKVIVRRDITLFGIYFNYMGVNNQPVRIIKEVLQHLNMEINRVIGVGAKEYLVSILMFVIDLYTPHCALFSDELLKLSVKLSDVLFALEDYSTSISILRKTIQDFTPKTSLLDKVRVYLKLAENAVELEDRETTEEALNEVQKYASAGMNNRMSKRPSTTGHERTFQQVYQITSAKVECLKGEFGFASHLFWQVSMEAGPDQHECRRFAVLAAIMCEEESEIKGMYITMEIQKDIEGLQTLKKMVSNEILEKKDLEDLNEYILPYVHVVRESGLSLLQERIIRYQLSVGLVDGQIEKNKLVGLFDGKEEEIMNYVGQLV